MAEVRSCQANVNLEPTILEIVRKNFPSTSDYIRTLIVEDLTKRQLLTAKELLKMMLGDSYDMAIELLKTAQAS